MMMGLEAISLMSPPKKKCPAARNSIAGHDLFLRLNGWSRNRESKWKMQRGLLRVRVSVDGDGDKEGQGEALSSNGQLLLLVVMPTQRNSWVVILSP